MNRIRNKYRHAIEKIFYLASGPIPSDAANAIHVAHMCEALSDIGYDLTLIAPTGRLWGANISQGLGAHYGIKADFEAVGLWHPNIRGGHWPYQRLLGRIISGAGPSLVYGRNLTGCRVAAEKGYPTVFEAHMPVWDRARRIQTDFDALVAQPTYVALVVISRALHDAFLELYPTLEGRIVIAPDGAPKWPSPEPPPVANGDRLQIAYVGSLYPGKGIELLVQLALVCPWAHFVVVGGTESEILKWRSALPRETGNLEFLGRKPHRLIRQYMSSAHVLVAPYQRSVEAHGGGGELAPWMSPLKVFEYMAAGRPVVASDLPVIREVLENERNSLLVDPDDPKAWRAALERLRATPELAERLAQTARLEYETKYTWHSRAERIMQALQNQSKLNSTCRSRTGIESQ